jgi:hypothetical protein
MDDERLRRDRESGWAVYLSAGSHTGTPVVEGEQTFRFRAESRVTYALALMALARIARDAAWDFTYGPLNMGAVEEQGLVVSGPDVASWADDFLREVPGLHRAEE